MIPGVSSRNGRLTHGLTIVAAAACLWGTAGCGGGGDRNSKLAATGGSTVTLGGEVVFQSARGDRPIKEAVVKAVVDERTVGEAMTDMDGRFKLEGLPMTPFNLLVVTDEDFEDYDHFRKAKEYIDPATFANGRKFLAIRLEGRQTVLSGVVVGEDGKAVEGATVRTYPGTITVTTDAEGRFDLRSGLFEAIDYRVEAIRPGFQSQLSESIRPAIGGSTDIGTLTLSAYQLDKTGTGKGELETSGTGSGEVTTGEK